MSEQLHRTTMRLPERTIALIDAARGDRNRTEYIVDLVDSAPLIAKGNESERCDRSYEHSCYFGQSDNR